MKLTDLLAESSLLVPLRAGDRFEAIGALIGLLDAQGKFRDREAVLKAVVEREHQRATGMEFGLAVPHGRSTACREPVLAVGLADPPVDFQCADGKAARVIVLLVGPPDQTGAHIQVLARISRLMLNEDFRKDIAKAQSPGEAYAAFGKHEK